MKQKAKADIVDGERSKLQLERDVRLLYDLLERAKKERKCYGAVVKGLERSVAVAEERRIKVLHQCHHDIYMFKCMPISLVCWR